MSQVTYLRNLLTLRLHGNPELLPAVKMTSWRFYNRLLMADKIGRLVGYSDQPNYRAFLANLQEKLECLEDRGLIRISGERIFYSLSMSTQEGRLKRLDIIKTLYMAVMESVDPKVQQEFEAGIRRAINNRWREVVAPRQRLDKIEQELPNMLWARFRHPRLFLQARETAAGRVLRSLSPMLAEESRETVKRRFPETAPRVAHFEQALAEVKQLTCREVRERLAAAEMPAVVPKRFEIGNAAMVISDVHLKPEPHAQTEELMRLFYLCLAQNLSLIINGDLLDFYVFSSDFVKIIKANPLIAMALSKLPSVLIIPGNHDSAIFSFSDQVRELWPNVRLAGSRNHFDGRVFIEHGHQRDPHNAPGVQTGEMIVKSLTLLQKLRLLSPGMTAWFELALRFGYNVRSMFTGRNEWGVYKKERLRDRVRLVFDYANNSQERRLTGRGKFHHDDPHIYVGSHDHGPGTKITTQEAVQMVHDDIQLAGPDLRPAVRYFNTGCINGDGNEADFLIVDMQPQRVFVYPFTLREEHDQFLVWE